MAFGYRACRQACKLSMQAAATSLGVSIATLSRWERGETSPDAVRLRAMAELYGVSADTLIAERQDNAGTH